MCCASVSRETSTPFLQCLRKLLGTKRGYLSSSPSFAMHATLLVPSLSPQNATSLVLECMFRPCSAAVRLCPFVSACVCLPFSSRRLFAQAKALSNFSGPPYLSHFPSAANRTRPGQYSRHTKNCTFSQSALSAHHALCLPLQKRDKNATKFLEIHVRSIK